MHLADDEHSYAHVEMSPSVKGSLLHPRDVPLTRHATNRDDRRSPEPFLSLGGGYERTNIFNELAAVRARERQTYARIVHEFARPLPANRGRILLESAAATRAAGPPQPAPNADHRRFWALDIVQRT